MHLDSLDPATPQGLRLAAISGVRVAEENQLSVLGSIPSLPAVFEVAFNDWQQLPAKFWIHPAIPVTYLGMWSGKRNLAEFQLGRWSRVPVNDPVQNWIARMMTELQNVRPIPRVSPVNQAAMLAEVYRQTGVRWHGSLSTGSTL